MHMHMPVRKGDVNIIITILFTILQNPHEFMELVGALVVYNITIPLFPKVWYTS